jgi:methylglutaconyl-CoA hydratase
VSTNVNTGAVGTAGDVTMEIAEGIATVTFGHPKGNSMPGGLLKLLALQIAAAGADPRAKVIVLRSEGTGPFCAGASFDELAAIRDTEQGKEFFSGFSRVILAMIRAPKFIVARVHGKVAGGGVGLVAASDFSMALGAASAKLSELAVGIGPFVVGPAIERKIGLAAFSAMAVDADWRDAAWCERHGLYSRVYSDPSEMDDAIAALSRTLAHSNPDAMAQLKKVFWAGTDEWDLWLAERAEMSGRMVLSEFTRNAIARFRGK